MATDSAYRASFYVPKGGVGKTTSAAHIGACAAQEFDLDVVLVDLAGSQNDLATHFGVDPGDVDGNISATMGEDWDEIQDLLDDVLERLTLSTESGVDLIPADDGLDGVDNRLASVPVEDRYGRFDDFLESYLAPSYDVVLVDLPGAENNVAINGLYAAPNVVVPLKPGAFEQGQFQGLHQDLKRLREDLDAAPLVYMTLATMIRQNVNQHQEFVDDLEAESPEHYGGAIRNSADVGSVQKRGKTLFDVSDIQLYDTGKAARKAYWEATKHLLRQFEVDYGE